MAYYMDTSALVKLVIAEAESEALGQWLAERERRAVSCDLTRAELIRVVRRVDPARMRRAREVLDSVTLLAMTAAICEEAGRLEPTVLRTLDAVHVAAALDIGDELDGIVTYDERLADAARANGIAVVAPRP
jgi:uncharacterized protein